MIHTEYRTISGHMGYGLFPADNSLFGISLIHLIRGIRCQHQTLNYSNSVHFRRQECLFFCGIPAYLIVLYFTPFIFIPMCSMSWKHVIELFFDYKCLIVVMTIGNIVNNPIEHKRVRYRISVEFNIGDKILFEIRITL